MAHAQQDADFLNKPQVIPAAEKAYHAVYIELDTLQNNGPHPLFGQMYVALIEDQFTFGGDLENWADNKFHDGKRSCKSFMGTNVHHMCNDDYFLVHQDMILLRKTVFGEDGKKPDLKKACSLSGSGFTGAANEAKLLYRYKQRIPMAYKKGTTSHKCIGTYDVDTDTFTCMMNDDSTATATSKKLVPVEIPGFLYDTVDGSFARQHGQVEVFCKQTHRFK